MAATAATNPDHGSDFKSKRDSKRDSKRRDSKRDSNSNSDSDGGSDHSEGCSRSDRSSSRSRSRSSPMRGTSSPVSVAPLRGAAKTRTQTEMQTKARTQTKPRPTLSATAPTTTKAAKKTKAGTTASASARTRSSEFRGPPREADYARSHAPTPAETADKAREDFYAALLPLATTTDPLPLPTACVEYSRMLTEPDRLRAAIEAMTEDAAGPFTRQDVEKAQELLEVKTAEAERAGLAGISAISERVGTVANLAEACNRRWRAIEALIAKGHLNHGDALLAHLIEKFFLERRLVIARIAELGVEYAA